MLNFLKIMNVPNNINKDYQVEDPTDNSQRILIRNTVTGFEQGIAAVAGLFTGGPIAAIASWGAIRGLQGKWTPWFILGIPSCVVINLINIAILASIGITFSEDDRTSTLKNINNHLNVVATKNIDDPKFIRKLS